MDKGQIRDTALELFSKISFAKTSVADIAKACGLGKGTIYLHFQSKDEIFFSIIEERIRKEEALSEGYYNDPSVTTQTKVRRFFENLVDEYFVLKELMFGSFDNIKGSVLKEVFFKYGTLYQWSIDRLYGIVRSNVNEGKQCDQNLRENVAELMDLMVGRILLALVARDWNDKEGLKTTIAPLAEKLYCAMIA